jgi:ubiquinone/menaquinone biosynthesis C-methylase UbiE
MLISDAVELIRRAIPRTGGTWADIGAGDGTFTRALIELLGPTARIYAVDRDAKALANLEAWAARHHANVIPVVADITRPFDLPGLEGGLLDGVLLANALHFVPESKQVLARLAALVRLGGRVVIVEYDRSGSSRWVPYPIPAAQLPELSRSAGLSHPVFTATRPSAFGGNLYTASADRLA